MARHDAGMRRFAELFLALDGTTSTQAKVAALRRYFLQVNEADAAWAVYFLSGGKPRQAVPSAVLRAAARQAAGLPEWLFDESYQAVGDLAETIAHVLPAPTQSDDTGLAEWVSQRLLGLRGLPPAEQMARLTAWWAVLDTSQRFLLIKLIGGGFRVGVSKLLVQRALADAFQLDAKTVALRMMGYTDARHVPTAQAFARLVAPVDEAESPIQGQAYPFFLAHALTTPTDALLPTLGPVSDWLVEWKYDGIRAQVVKRDGQVWIWSRGEELVSERFPEVVERVQSLPDGCVLDGELLVIRPDGQPAPFAVLQQRIGRKTLSKKLLADAPVQFVAYDLLERDGQDCRGQAQHWRREQLEQLLATRTLALSPRVEAQSWEDLAQRREESRARGVEGFMLKNMGASYGAGRTKADGVWWKWKIDPMHVDAVLIYAQAGHGRRASLYTDYTFAVWNRTPRDAHEAQAVVDAIARREPPKPDGLQLVAFAKAYSGLTDEEIRTVDRRIRQTTLEKFGPVRSVKPTLVFELGFEGINASARHKSGIAVRFPRMLRIRSDKALHEANTLADLRALMNPAGGDV